MAMGKYGKDKPENFIAGALKGEGGTHIEEGVTKSDCMSYKSIGRSQRILTAVALDNVDLALDVETSIMDEGGFRGSINNVGHSLTGASGVSDDLGTAGPVKHVIIPNH